jgi:argininosuccinate lyase
MKKFSGACVRLAEEKKVSLDTLSLDELKAIDSRFDADVAKVWDYEVSVERKSSIGGTAKASVLKQIEDVIAFAKTLE